jgi:hypothetical protein
MASIFGKLTELARSPQGKKVISQATRKAQQLANDPATRAKIDQGTARLKAEVAKRRTGSSTATGSTTGSASNPTTGPTGTVPTSDVPPTGTTYQAPPSTSTGPDDLTAR